MTFHLDYDRLSELSDTVGYWYVDSLGDGWCRVYYSTDSRLPRFIPSFAKDAMIVRSRRRSNPHNAVLVARHAMLDPVSSFTFAHAGCWRVVLLLQNLAAKRSTGWVEKRCNELTGYVPSGRSGRVGRGPVAGLCHAAKTHFMKVRCRPTRH